MDVNLDKQTAATRPCEKCFRTQIRDKACNNRNYRQSHARSRLTGPGSSAWASPEHGLVWKSCFPMFGVGAKISVSAPKAETTTKRSNLLHIKPDFLCWRAVYVSWATCERLKPEFLSRRVSIPRPRRNTNHFISTCRWRAAVAPYNVGHDRDPPKYFCRQIRWSWS